MAYKIIFQKDFLKKSVHIANWLEINWSKKSADKFASILYQKLTDIQNNPFIGQICKNDIATRKILISPHNKLFYRVKGKTIYIITLFDTRQDPKKNKYE